MSELASSPPAAGPAAAAPAQSVEPASGPSSQPSPRHQLPNPSGGGQAPPGPPAPSPAVTLAASLAQVAEGTHLSGVVIGQDANRQPVLTTDKGTFVITGQQALPPNTELSLKVLSVGILIRALLIARNGQALLPPPEVTLTLTGINAPPPDPGLPGAPPRSPAGPASASLLASGARIVGTVLAEPGTPSTAAWTSPAKGSSATVTTHLSPGTRLVFQVRSTTPPATPAPTGSGAGSGDAVPKFGVGGGAERAAAPGPGATLLRGARQSGSPAAAASRAGSQAATATPAAAAATAASAVTATGNSSSAPAATSSAMGASGKGNGATPRSRVSAPSASPAPAGPASPGTTTAGPRVIPAAAWPQLTGIVAGHGQDGLPLVRLAVGLVRLETPEPVALGTKVVLDVLSSSPPPEASAVAAKKGAVQSTALDLAREWPALKEALEIVQSINPAVAQRLITNVIPGPNAALPAGILFFLAALRLGDITGWLGREATQALERTGRGGLLRRLADDFARLSQLADERSSGDWRTFVVPISDGRHLHQVRMLMRHNRRPGKEEEMGTRFVVDLDLSHIGAFQFDGLVRRDRFDLIVRSFKPLAAGMRGDISGIFGKGIAAIGLTGSVTFRTEPTFPLSALDEVARRDGDPGADGLLV